MTNLTRPSVPDDTVLRVSELSVNTRSLSVVKDVSFHVQCGEMVALVGASGAGKSLLGRGLIGLLPPGFFSTGRVELRDKNGHQARVGWVPQEPSLGFSPLFTLGDQICTAARNHRKTSRRQVEVEVLNWLERLGLIEPRRFLNAYPHEVSGGEAQRLLLALALVREPELLVADEPTASLDALTGQDVLNLLNELRQKRGLAVLLITHDLRHVQHRADHVAVIHEGVLVEFGAVNHVLRKPSHPATRRLLDACGS